MAPEVTPERWDAAAEGALTIREACRWSGLSRTRVYELLAEGVLRSTRVGGRRLIFRASLRRVLAAGAEDPPARSGVHVNGAA